LIAVIKKTEAFIDPVSFGIDVSVLLNHPPTALCAGFRKKKADS